MSQYKNWRGYSELENSPEFKAMKRNEFPEELPVMDEVVGMEDANHTPRRDFLKLMGFSLAAATIAASCETPIRKAIPYVMKPEEITPGVANYYASTFVNGSDFLPVLVKTREGRPIKIEGNQMSTLTNGGTSAKAQASVVSLYDMARSRGPKMGGEAADWSALDKAVKAALAGGTAAILTSSVYSPSTKRLFDAFSNKFPGAKIVQYEPVSNAGILYANERSFGQKAIPGYQFDKAEVIASIGCDFLGTWVSPTEFAVQYVKNRRIDAENPKMSRHYQFESRLSQTGSNADYRFTVKPSQEALVVQALYNELSGAGAGVNLPEAAAAGVKKCASDLKAASGRALVVCGSNDVNVQIVVNAINNLLGSYGNTIDWGSPYKNIGGDDKAIKSLMADMSSGLINTVIIYNSNPVYDFAEGAAFAAALKKVPTSISMNDREDETAEAVKILAPANHYLESWNDAEPRAGHFFLAQPTIAPLFNTRSFQDSLMRWMDMPGDYYTYIRETWNNAFGGGESFWNTALQNGVFTRPTAISAGSFSGDVGAAISALATKAASANGVEISLFEGPVMGNGKYANNPFLQETPDPVTKVCWDNYAMISKKTADKLGLTESVTKNGNSHLKVSLANNAVELPIVIMPGMAEDVVAIPVGYGRTKPGNEHCATGANVYPMVDIKGETFEYNLSGATIEKAEGRTLIAQTQTHHTIDDRRRIINDTSINEYKEDKFSGNVMGRKMRDEGWKDHYFTTLYPSREKEYTRGHHWGLAIDMNACIGCGACVPACHIENNVPVVGQQYTADAKEMHWMRIDRYFAHDIENDQEALNVKVAFQPMMCQHCDNAPCENVCPVNATNHSAEGLNQMAYNRCIGTRYCANNCPYKVRRFNWFDFQGADSFYKNTIFNNDEYSYADDLMRMVLNPDVTVRSRGVMEKCTFCVQRIQEGKLTAKKEGRPLKDGEIQTACAAACPTNAIIFGDQNDPESKVAKAKLNERNYGLLEEIHILPNVSYLTKIRNIDEVINEKYVHQEMSHGGSHDKHGNESGHGENHGKTEAHGEGAVDHQPAQGDTTHTVH